MVRQFIGEGRMETQCMARAVRIGGPPVAEPEPERAAEAERQPIGLPITVAQTAETLTAADWRNVLWLRDGVTSGIVMRYPGPYECVRDDRSVRLEGTFTPGPYERVITTAASVYLMRPPRG
jgi:hypothetical protein